MGQSARLAASTRILAAVLPQGPARAVLTVDHAVGTKHECLGVECRFMVAHI